MKIALIKELPSVIGAGPNSSRYHESLFRSYHILLKVKELLELGTPQKVILEIIEDIENAPESAKEI